MAAGPVTQLVSGIFVAVLSRGTEMDAGKLKKSVPGEPVQVAPAIAGVLPRNEPRMSSTVMTGQNRHLRTRPAMDVIEGNSSFMLNLVSAVRICQKKR
ncbi:hypothetical protein D9M73_241920 [compost metagenome]